MNVSRISPSTKTRPSDLETRVANRKQELISEIIEHKLNSSRIGAAEAIEKIKARLSELAHIVEPSTAASLGQREADRKLKLDEWITR